MMVTTFEIFMDSIIPYYSVILGGGVRGLFWTTLLINYVIIFYCHMSRKKNKSNTNIFQVEIVEKEPMDEFRSVF